MRKGTMKGTPMTVPACPFCNSPDGEILLQNEYCYARKDAYPVSPGHLLIIPFRHVPDAFNLSREERIAIGDLLDRCRELVERKLSPDGYNIGVNIGEAAGQSVMHVHIHFIPRFSGDTPYPGGGVRHAIPGRGEYPGVRITE